MNRNYIFIFLILFTLNIIAIQFINNTDKILYIALKPLEDLGVYKIKTINPQEQKEINPANLYIIGESVLIAYGVKASDLVSLMDELPTACFNQIKLLDKKKIQIIKKEADLIFK